MSGSENTGEWNKKETAGFIYFGSYGMTNLDHIAEFMERKCNPGTKRPKKELEARLQKLANSTKVYDSVEGLWNRDQGIRMIHQMIREHRWKAFLEMMKYTKEDERILTEKGYTFTGRSVQPSLSISATASGPQMTIPTSRSHTGNSTTAPSGKNPLRRTATEDPDIGESSHRAPKRSAASLRASAGGLSGPIAGNFGMGDVSASLPQIGDSMTATSGSSSFRGTASEDPGLGETSRRSQKLPAAAPAAYANPQHGPNQAERSLAPSDQPALRADQIALRWSTGEAMNEASYERWAMILGSLPEFAWAWGERRKVLDAFHANVLNRDRGWNDLEDQEVAYWRAQGLPWAGVGKKMVYHPKRASENRWNQKLSADRRFHWVDGVKKLSLARLAEEEKQAKRGRG